jgi:CRISPR-associated protein Cas2
MMVIVTENAPPRLRGRLSLWFAEVRAGVYVGVYNRRVRERIWDEVKIMIGDGSAVIAWAAPTDSGFEFECIGANRREAVDFDGLTLVRFKPPAPPKPGPETPKPDAKPRAPATKPGVTKPPDTA